MRRSIAIVWLTALGTGLIFQGSFGQVVGIFALGAYLLAPAALFLGVAAVVQLRRGEVSRWTKTWTRRWGVLAVGLVASFGTGRLVHSYNVWSTREYVALATAKLDEIKRREGRFPSEIPVAELGTPPLLLRLHGHYASDGKTFRFEYSDPAGLMDAYEFTSDRRQWIYFD